MLLLIWVRESTLVPLQDDKFSSTIPIGFSFCFYGNIYTQCVLSSNGPISFNLNYANGIAAFQTMQPLPYFNSTFPDDAIFCSFVDYNIQQGGTIRYKTIGMAPFRKFIVEYAGMHYFGGICTMPGTSTIECILNETYNTIEIHVSNKPIYDGDPANWLNYSTIGVQGVAAASSYAIPGMNAWLPINLVRLNPMVHSLFMSIGITK